MGYYAQGLLQSIQWQARGDWHTMGRWLQPDSMAKVQLCWPRYGIFLTHTKSIGQPPAQRRLRHGISCLIPCLMLDGLGMAIKRETWGKAWEITPPAGALLRVACDTSEHAAPPP